MDLSIGVVVPSYRRPEHLRGCLAALLAQQRAPNEVLVVARPDDAASLRVIGEFPAPVRLVVVEQPGLLAAMTAGAIASTTAIVAFTDDDAEPPPAWVRQLLEAFEDPAVGGVGGRDLIAGDEGAAALVVGRVTSWGRLIGNHNRACGPARAVDVLKGVNMAYRREALALPSGYRGTSTHAHTEVAMGLWARSRGWILRYDPAIVVIHHEATRSHGLGRERWRPDAASEVAYNLVAGMLAAQPERFLRRCLYGVLIGDRGTPGFARGVASMFAGHWQEALAVLYSLRGQTAALVHTARGTGVTMRRLVDLDGDRSAG